jgi:sugar phosphate permease
VVLAAGVVAIAVGCLFQFGLPYLVPHLRAEGLSLPQASLLAASPSFGLMATLVLWGAAADRWGERLVLAAGLAVAAPFLALAALLARSDGVGPTAVCLALAGAGGASVHAASGRLILGWFPARRRGLAMGIRQTAQPIGVGSAALLLPVLAERGTAAALVVLAVACAGAVVLVLAVVRDAPRPGTRPGLPAPVSPYRTPVLWRIHAASALLVLPQFTVAAFALTYLVDVHGWDPIDGGRLLAVAQGGGAAARLLAGWWSDRAGSRTGPLRLVSIAIAVTLGVLAVTTAARLPVSVGLLMAAAVVTVSPNGLAFTAVAEYAGGTWAGRALGLQNTAQNGVAALTPPLMAAVISGPGYPAAFAVAAVLPVVAGAFVPHPLPPSPAASVAEPAAAAG